ncbi:hypothetical protein N7475_001058 [Penicillium sp. IBT 31633x]|nr:hypothetical protein N7475_001058 [Penicillium sp. IBT 31633x]
MVAALRRTSELGEITRRSGASRDPATPDPPPSRRGGGPSPRCAPAASAVVTEARGPFGPRHRWSLWIDGRWPYPKLRFLEGAIPREPPFVGVVRGVWTLHPRAVCRSLPAPSRASGRINCVRTGTEELSGGNWMVVSVLPVRRGCRRDRAPRAPLPFNYILPPRGSGLSGPLAARRACPRDVLP